MTHAARWGWVLLFALLAVAAVLVNARSHRIFILHEGQASQPATQAFFRGADAILQQQPRLKTRRQFLGSDADACRQALSQLRAFQPDVVIAEGLHARQCMEGPGKDAVPRPLAQPPLNADDAARAAYVEAWATVLTDLAPAAGTMVLLRSADAEAQLESEFLSAAARKVGLELREVLFATTEALNADLEGAVEGVLDDATGLLIVGRTLARDADDGQDLALREVFSRLRTVTALPLLATRLNSVRLGADLALDQAPEQRGEQLAYWARHGRPMEAAGDAPPLEMAVSLRADFATRQGARWPSFYEASARLAGLWFEAEKPVSR